MSTKNLAPAKTVRGKPAQYTLAVIEFKDGREITHCENIMSPDQFDALMEKGRGAGDLTCRAILDKAIQTLLTPSDSFELENATAANNALMQLLCENIEFQRLPGQTSAFGCDGTEAATLCFGISQLVQSCRGRLDKALEVAS